LKRSCCPYGIPSRFHQSLPYPTTISAAAIRSPEKEVVEALTPGIRRLQRVQVFWLPCRLFSGIRV
ncbi:MAG: hypothetical protein VX608_09970, partial [Chloroflexota bacterium]|nr:hypothetical protein [Chloroflexota bacterium]